MREDCEVLMPGQQDSEESLNKEPAAQQHGHSDAKGRSSHFGRFSDRCRRDKAPTLSWECGGDVHVDIKWFGSPRRGFRSVS